MKRTEIAAAGLPKALSELRAVLATVNDMVYNLNNLSTWQQMDAVADEIYRALNVARDGSRQPSTTGCVNHPRGPVDLAAPEGWSRCWFCNMRRIQWEKQKAKGA